MTGSWGSGTKSCRGVRTDDGLCDGRRARQGRVRVQPVYLQVLSNAEKYWLDWFESKPWTTCFVDGNHENHHALANLPVREWNGGLVHEVRPHVLHLMRGEVFDIDGLTVLAMGGAASNDRQYRREGRSWWPEEMPSEEEMEHCRASLDRVGWKVDHVVTHEAPADLAEQLCREREREYLDDRLQRFLGELDGRLGCRAWFFGHYHGDEWRDARHRLIYRDIVSVEDAAPASRNLLEAL